MAQKTMQNKQNTGGAPQSGQNRMATAPVGRLLFSMALPMTVSMLFQAFYNVVDSYFAMRMFST